MRHHSRLGILCFGLIGLIGLIGLMSSLTLPIMAQTPKVPLIQRGPELERLDFLVGHWNGELTRYLPGGAKITLTPTIETTWDVGEVWLQSSDQTELPNGTTIHNRTRITWDDAEGTYTGAWQDNVYAGLVTFKGQWIDDQRLELDTGEFTLFDRPHRVVYVYDKISNDEFNIMMHQSWDGAEATKVAEGRFVRNSGAKTGAGNKTKVSKTNYGTLNPAAPPETEQFEFAIGEWDCTTRSMQPDGSLVAGPSARWTFYYILDGWAIQDDWVSSQPDGSTFIGTNIRSFNQKSKKWDNHWLAMGKLEWTYYESEQVGETMVMTGGRGTDSQGRKFVDRNTFHNIKEDSWSWRKDRSYDDGETWLEGVFWIEAKRKGAK